MKVNIIGRHVEISPATREHAKEKAAKLDHYFAGIQHVDVVVAASGQNQHVEMVVVLGQGATLVAKAVSEDVIKAIDQAEGRLQKQIRRFHARLKAHRDRTRIAGEKPGPPADEEATYQQVVKELLEEDEKH